MASGNPTKIYAGPFSTSTPTPHEAFKFLRQWVDAHRRSGVYLDQNLVFAHDPQWGNGFVALTPWGIPADTTVVKMPKSHCLTTRTVNSPQLRELLRSSQFDPVTAMTIAYMYECRPDYNSPWSGYLGCLSLPDVPRLWVDEEKAWLKGTDIEDQTFDFDRGAVELFRQTVDPFFRNHPEIFPMVNHMQSPQLEKAYLESMSVVMSRIFPIDAYHGLGLVPLADLFNHARVGHEHVEFQTDKDVCERCGAREPIICECNLLGPNDPCDTCGKPPEDNCSCRTLCPVCGDPPEEECDCRTWNEFMYYPVTETAILDPDGRGWVYKPRELRATRPPESCDVILVKYVHNNEQVFNNYGALNNVDTLSKYGFVDPDCEINTVCLRREIFYHQTEYYIPDMERTKYWFDHGFEFLSALAQHESRPFGKEWKQMVEKENIPERGREFVLWSLTIGKGGHVRCGLKVWLFIADLAPSLWTEFMALSLNDKVESGLHYLAIFDRPRELTQVEKRIFTGWLNILRQAVQKRYDRYSQQEKDEYVMRKVANRVKTVDLRTRKGKANWIKDMEMGILNDCERKVRLSLVLLDVNLPQTLLNWLHPNGHFVVEKESLP